MSFSARIRLAVLVLSFLLLAPLGRNQTFAIEEPQREKSYQVLYKSEQKNLVDELLEVLRNLFKKPSLTNEAQKFERPDLGKNLNTLPTLPKNQIADGPNVSESKSGAVDNVKRFLNESAREGSLISEGNSLYYQPRYKEYIRQTEESQNPQDPANYRQRIGTSGIAQPGITQKNITPTNKDLPLGNTINEIKPGEQKIYTIALLGDSMTQTLEKYHDDLNKLLSGKYPDKKFIILNFGQASTNIENGLYRLTNQTISEGRQYQPLLSYKPDILVIESFAYNHWSGETHDLDRQWAALSNIIDTVKKKSPYTQIVFSAAISPDPKTYGDGVLNWNTNQKYDAALITKAYLLNLLSFAKSAQYPVADAYHPSLDNDGNGQNLYISETDNIHPSRMGALLYFKQVADAIIRSKLIN